MESESITNLLQHLSEQPEDWSLRARVCDAFLMEGRQGEATNLIETAPEPPQHEPHVLKAAEVYAKSEPQKAVALLHRYLEQQDPNSAIVHLAMAEIAVKLGELATAKNYYERAVELNPNYRDPELERNLGVSQAAPHPAGQTKPASRTLPPPPANPGPASTPVTGPAARRLAAESKSDEPPPKTIPSWVFTLIIALGTFLLCWLVLALILRAMLLQAVAASG